MSVEDVVEQAVHQESHTTFRQVRGLVPPLDYRIDIEVLVLANGHQCAFGDERRHFGSLQLTGADIQTDRVRAEERVCVVPVDLRPLVLMGGVLRREVCKPSSSLIATSSPSSGAHMSIHTTPVGSVR